MRSCSICILLRLSYGFPDDALAIIAILKVDAAVHPSDIQISDPTSQAEADMDTSL